MRCWGLAGALLCFACDASAFQFGTVRPMTARSFSRNNAEAVSRSPRTRLVATLANNGIGFQQTSAGTTLSDKKHPVAIHGDNEISRPSELWLARALILGCCMIYGSNFACGSILLQTAPAPVVSGLRFTLAGLALSPFLRQLDRRLLAPGICIGALLAFAYLGQSVALTTIAAGKVGFFCALSVLVCPVLEVVFDGKRLSPRLLVSAFLAIVGVGMMELSHGALPGPGDLWAIAQPLGFGGAYFLTAKTLRKHPGQELPLTAMQTAVVGSIAMAWMLSSQFAAATVLNGAFLAPILAAPAAMAALCYTGFFTTASARILETRALAKISSSDAAVLMATEPVWAALFAFLLLGELTPPGAVLGGCLIMLACLISTTNLTLSLPRPLPPRHRAAPDDANPFILAPAFLHVSLTSGGLRTPWAVPVRRRLNAAGVKRYLGRVNGF